MNFRYEGEKYHSPLTLLFSEFTQMTVGQTMPHWAGQGEIKGFHSVRQKPVIDVFTPEENKYVHSLESVDFFF